MAEENVSYVGSKLYRIRHSTAHVMAQAVLEMFPKAKIAIGPPIADGFYYDFDLPRPLTAEDLKKIEKRMKKIIKGNYQFVRRELSADEARELFADQPYKLELIDGLEAGGVDEYGEQTEDHVVISTYTQDSFEDLCRGPHVESTKEIRPDAVSITFREPAGAYWRGDENNPMLTRIYGTAWESREDLDAYLARLKEAKERDHRTLGRELDLFSFSQEVGPGLALWHPKGGRLRAAIEEYWAKRHREGGYERVFTPHIGKANLWETSGHLRWYQESMYAPIEVDEQEYYLKPMNCPFHIEIYSNQIRSYRDLPMRFAEFGTVYRYERSGVLHGLMRVRGFTQDDAHLFCTLEQMPDEISEVLDFSLSILRDFGYEHFDIELSAHDPDDFGKYAGEIEQWQMAEKALAEAIEGMDLPYKRVTGEAAFYGPKIDIKVRDALDRPWQLTTIQFDFWLPEAFKLEYIGADGQAHRPYMIHRALLGSLERFLGVLIEHYKGAFPVWLAPVQVTLIPITDRHHDYAYQVAGKLKAAGMRVEVDDSSDRMGNKIRKAQGQKVPYMLVIGDREQEDEKVAVRLRSGSDLGAMAVEGFLELAQKAIDEKALELAE